MKLGPPSSAAYAVLHRRTHKGCGYQTTRQQMVGGRRCPTRVKTNAPGASEAPGALNSRSSFPATEPESFRVPVW